MGMDHETYPAIRIELQCSLAITQQITRKVPELSLNETAQLERGHAMIQEQHAGLLGNVHR